MAKKRKQKTPHQKLVDRVWELCKAVTRKKYRRDDGKWECYTCGKLLEEPYKVHTGHCFPSGSCGMFLRYDLRNLRPQCFYCNINMGGEGAKFLTRLGQEEGAAFVKKLRNGLVVNIKDLGYDSDSWLTKLEKKYKKM